MTSTGTRPAVPWGRVVAFDANVGLGTVEADDGRRVRFHCTAIADGSRAVPVGARVRIEVGPGRGGHWEARVVEVIGGAG